MAEIPNIVPALTLVGFELARTCHADDAPEHVLDWIEAAQVAAFNMPKSPVPIGDLYGHLVHTATCCMAALALLPPPNNIEGVEGFDDLFT